MGWEGAIASALTSACAFSVVVYPFASGEMKAEMGKFSVARAPKMTSDRPPVPRALHRGATTKKAFVLIDFVSVAGAAFRADSYHLC